MYDTCITVWVSFSGMCQLVFAGPQTSATWALCATTRHTHHISSSFPYAFGSLPSRLTHTASFPADERHVGPVCDDALPLVLSCPEGEAISYVSAALYGRSDATTCPYKWEDPAPKVANTNCVAPDYRAKVRVRVCACAWVRVTVAEVAAFLALVHPGCAGCILGRLHDRKVVMVR